MRPEWTVLFVCNEGDEPYTCSTTIELGVMPADPMAYLPEEAEPEHVSEVFVFAGKIEKHDILD